MAENQKKIGRWFNSADMILVLALLAVLCGIIFRRPVENMIADRFSAVNIRYTMTVYTSDNQTDFLKNGDRIFNSDGENIGTIENVLSEEAHEYDGDERVRVTLTVISPGLSDSGGLYVGTGEPMFIAPGKTLEAHSSDYSSFTGMVKQAEKMQ